jgi:hypothetical protein
MSTAANSSAATTWSDKLAKTYLYGMNDGFYTLADLRRAIEALPPGSSVTLPRDALLQALGNGAAPKAEPEPADRLLTVREAAKRLGVSRRYVYIHRDEYPFTKPAV